jgi:putative endonuclease
MFEHTQGATNSFTKKYNICKIVYFNSFHDPKEAISGEKRIKGWTRKKKIDLIKSLNPCFRDLLT